MMRPCASRVLTARAHRTRIDDTRGHRLGEQRHVGLGDQRRRRLVGFGYVHRGADRSHRPVGAPLVPDAVLRALARGSGAETFVIEVTADGSVTVGDRARPRTPAPNRATKGWQDLWIRSLTTSTRHLPSCPWIE